MELSLGYKGRRSTNTDMTFGQDFKADSSLLSQVMSKSKEGLSNAIPSNITELAAEEEPEQEYRRRRGVMGDGELLDPILTRESMVLDTDGNPVGNQGSYFKKLAGVESGGKWDALNPGSGAYGRYQFVPATEKQYAKKLGITIEQARTPSGQNAMVSAFTKDNAAGLKRAGFAPTQRNLYLAHQQGLGGAITMLNGGQASKINLESNNVSNTDEWMHKFGRQFT